ncbi:MAG: RCC1 domain-containing protein, partial [Actinomycetota bacterium]
MKTHRTKSLALVTLAAFILVSCGPTERSSTDGTIALSKGAGGVVRPCKKVGASARLGGSNAVCALNGKTRMLFTVKEITKQRCNQVGRLRPAGLELSVCGHSGLALRWMRVINPYVVDQSESMTEVGDTPVAGGEAKTEQTSPQANSAGTSESTTSGESAVSRPPLPTSLKNTVVSTADTTVSTPDSAYDVLEIGTGRSFACALLRDRTVSCWGDNYFGELGSIDLRVESDDLADARCFNSFNDDPSSGCTFATIVEDRQTTNVVTKYITPTREQANQTLVRQRVPGVSNAKKLYVGELGACAVGMTGRVTCWGAYGFQKNFTVLSREAAKVGTTIIRILPTEIGGLSNVVDLALGNPTCAVLSSGRVTCWKSEIFGISAPREIPGITNAVSITALGANRGVTPFCAVLRDSTARCWPDPKGLLTANVGRSLSVAMELFDGQEVPRSKPILRCKLNGLTCEERVYTYGRRSIDCSA